MTTSDHQPRNDEEKFRCLKQAKLFSGRGLRICRRKNSTHDLDHEFLEQAYCDTLSLKKWWSQPQTIVNYGISWVNLFVFTDLTLLLTQF